MIAIVADWFDINSGAEKCIKAFVEEFNGDIFSLVDFFSKEDRDEILKGKFAKTTFLQNVPFSKEIFRNLLFLFPYAIESIDLRDYKIVLSSSHSVAKNVLTSSEQIHICYCHTPMRYIWDLYFDYKDELGSLKKFIFSYFAKRLREWDYSCRDRVDFYIANSNYVKRRIKKIYNKEAKVIYPPVEVEDFEISEKKDNYYITISRLVGYKKVDLIIKAFNENGKKLLVVGGGDIQKYKKIAKKNVEILGFLPRDEIKELLKNAKAFVYAAKEDFGIAPVEAMAAGVPVIAYNQGGVVESVGEFGVYFDKQEVDSINKAIKEFEKKEFDPYELRARAMKFNSKRFKKEIRDFVDKVSNRIYN